MARPTTAIIGAGISGLTGTKMLGDYGIPHTCFEISDRVGGNWAFGNPNGLSSAYRSLHIDTSKHQLSFRDFPIPNHYPDFPHHTEIFRYLDDYAEAFELKERIEFGNGVVHARRLPGGGWELETQRSGTRRFDLLVVANGHHWDPRFPNFPGEFTGTQLHSHHYVDPRTPLDFSGNRILVVGIGNSAADIAVELSSKALRTDVTLSTRSSAWIVPKYFAGTPADRYYRTTPYLPLSWQRKLFQVLQPITAGRPESYGLPTPNHKFFEAHPTQSVELPLRLGSGDVIAKGDVARLDGKTVHFEDGSSAEFDVIVHATGYNITFPFFDEDFINAPDNRIRLYKRMFKPGLHDLVFLGFAQATPTLFPFVEAQSRLLAAYASGRYQLPSTSDMQRTIVADERKFTGHMVPTARHTQQLDYFLYEHDLRTRELPEGHRRARRAEAHGQDGLTRGQDRTGSTVAAPRSTRSSTAPSVVESYRRVSFVSGSDRCEAWHFEAAGAAPGRPCVVMAHGLGGTKDSGLQRFAEAFAAAGLDVLAFDYRGFGASGGAPRQQVSLQRQVEDYRAAMRTAAELPGVAGDRLVLWGVSLGGGHVLTAAVGCEDVAAVVSLTPLVSGAAGGRQALRTHRLTSMLRSSVAGLRSRWSVRLGWKPVMMPIVGRPGENAALSLPGCYEDYHSVAGPTWHNEVDASVVLELPGYRPLRQVEALRCPLLVQVADFDRSAPPEAAAEAAFRGRGEVRHYPCDHFDVWPGKDWFEATISHQLSFLRRHLSPVS